LAQNNGSQLRDDQEDCGCDFTTGSASMVLVRSGTLHETNLHQAQLILKHYQDHIALKGEMSVMGA
jgi:hypothetical protein